MADENNTLAAAAADEANQGAEPVSQSQDGAESTQTAAAEQANQGTRKLAGRFDTTEELEKAYKAAQAELTRTKQAQASPRQVKDALLGEQQTQGQQATQQAQQTQAQGAAAAQQMGGDAMERAYNNLVQQHGVAKANYLMTNYLFETRAKQMLEERVGPAEQRAYDAELTNAWVAVAVDNDLDPSDEAVTKQVNAFLASRPKLKQQLEQAQTRADMYEVLDFAMGRVRKETAKTVSKAAESAGAKRESTRQAQAAAAGLEATRGSDQTRGSSKDPADDWLESMKTFEKGNNLF